MRCPKCHRALPRFSRNSSSPVGGTALPQSKQGSPLLALVIAILVGGGIIAFFALRGRHGTTAAAATPPPPAPAIPSVVELPRPAPPTPTPPPATAPAAPHGEPIAADLQRALQRQHLWSTVQAVGARVDIQSSSCRDPQLSAAIASVATSFKAAGLTHVRCVEQSGSVAFEREL